jgi:hypothetical protein
MKRFLAGLSVLAILAASGPAFAQGRDDHDRDHGRPEFRHGPPTRHFAPPPRHYHSYREGQIWNGHHLTNRGGNWGYYQPRSGAQIFINIPL